MLHSCTSGHDNKTEVTPIPPDMHPLILLDELLLSHYGHGTPAEFTKRNNTTNIAEDSVDSSTLNTMTGPGIKTPSNKLPPTSDKRNLNLKRPTNVPIQHRVFHMIKGADFICSKELAMTQGSSSTLLPSLSSILECALELLDDTPSTMGTLNDRSPNDREKICVPVRLITASPSGRSFLVVRQNSLARKRRKSSLSGQEYDPLECLCLLGNSRITEKESSEATWKEKASTPFHSTRNTSTIMAGKMGFHCSCLSFFERLQHDRFAICKHLMAARLAPFLQSRRCCDIYREDKVSEEEFTKLYLQYSLL